MALPVNPYRTGAFKAIVVMGATLIAATVGHAGAAAAGLSPMFFEGAAGGAILGAFVYATLSKVRQASPLVDASSADRIEFDEPKSATVVAPPYEGEPMNVFAMETNPDGDYPFKVWVSDEGQEAHPYYATAVSFEGNPFKADT